MDSILGFTCTELLLDIHSSSSSSVSFQSCLRVNNCFSLFYKQTRPSLKAGEALASGHKYKNEI